MARNDPQVNFRIPAELKVRLEAEATANNRTLTAELVARLQAPSLTSDALTERLERSMFEANYALAQAGVRMLKFAAGAVLESAPAELQNISAYRLLRAAAESARVPPELPPSLSQVKNDLSPMDIERAIEGLRSAVDVLDARVSPRD